jgi:polysaccharide biosynthesis/export protein
MKTLTQAMFMLMVFSQACTTSSKLDYLSNLPEDGSGERFTMEIPNYIIQKQDILYITVKAMAPDGSIVDFLSTTRNLGGSYITQGESGSFLYGYDVNHEGNITIPVMGSHKVEGLTLHEARYLLQTSADKVYNNSTVECKLLSFKFTVIGEVRVPGTYINYNNYLTILEAIGRAGGLNDFGRRDRVLVIRPVGGGTRTYTLNIQDKKILSSEAYFILPNDVIIIEGDSKKVFNLNLPTYAFIVTTITSVLTTTLLLINYFK